jgi:3-methyladenine DNA glycosylase AlkC/predicted GIY-YIG superfamily endonuclease
MADLLKNNYNKTYITNLAKAFSKKYSRFDQDKFIALIFDSSWSEKELKERMFHISSTLKALLPKDYKKSIDIVLKVAPDFGGFEAMFFPDYVERFGADNSNKEVSLNALKELTKYSSSEFAIRPFIKSDESFVMKRLLKWSKDKNYHIRRLSSEGCRPRLPWAMALPKFKENPSLILPILENLKDDPEEYVRRSVANNLNDISKDNPKIVLKIAKKWIGHSKERDKLVKHALRTLLKAGNSEAMKLFGFITPKDVIVKNISLLDKYINIGESGEFSYEFKMKTPGKIRLEYAIDYLKKNGKHNRKVFKISENNYDEGIFSGSKKHSFKQMSTRKHYAGEHFISLIINGKEMKTTSFFLAEKSHWEVYMVETDKGVFYTGISTDVERRFEEHCNSKKGAKFFRGHKPKAIVYREVCKNRSDASKRECAIKKLTKSKKKELVKSYSS